MNNLRFALRQLRKAPVFTVTALATIAICLGANLAHRKGHVDPQLRMLESPTGYRGRGGQ